LNFPHKLLLLPHHSVFSESAIEKEKKLVGLERLVRSKIPMHSVFASICDRVWLKVVIRCRQITKSSIWPSLRRELIATLNVIEPDFELDMLTVLSDSTYRKYFDRYIRMNPSGTYVRFLLLYCENNSFD